MLDFVLYLLYRVGTAITSALPLRVLFAIGNFMGLGAWLLLTHYRRLAQRNLEIAFANEKAPWELRRIVRRHFQNLLTTCAHYFMTTASRLRASAPEPGPFGSADC